MKLLWVNVLVMVFMTTAAFNGFAEAQGGDSAISGRIFLRYSGAKNKIPINNDSSSELMAAQLLDLFDSADIRFRLMVTPQLIDEVRSGRYLELMFDRPRQTKPKGFNGAVIEISSLLIPFDGKFAWKSGQRCTIFYGTPRIEEFNVLGYAATSEEFDTIVDLIKEVEKNR